MSEIEQAMQAADASLDRAVELAYEMPDGVIARRIRSVVKDCRDRVACAAIELPEVLSKIKPADAVPTDTADPYEKEMLG